MSIVSAYVMPHPPLAVPAVGRGEESKIKNTIEAMQAIATEITELAPDVVVFITPHGTVYSDYFHISPQETAAGDFSRFGTEGTKYETVYDNLLALEIQNQAAAMDLPAGTQGQRNKQLDHGVLVPMHYINEKYSSYKSVRVSVSGLDSASHYKLGQAIARAANVLGKKIAVVASGDLSHKLSKNGAHGFHKDGAEFDKQIMRYMGEGDFLSLLMMPQKLRNNAAECGYSPFVVLAGCLDKTEISAKHLSYECPFGVGYGVISFSCMGENNSRNILELWNKQNAEQARALHENEDPYRALARKSLEHRLNYGKPMDFSANGHCLPTEMLEKKAGVFVSLHKNGELRGCIGTISPTTNTVAEEIIQNAVSAGLKDSRFSAVTVDELPLITYKVDVLDEPEEIESPELLDVFNYGVIVESGFKRGLLLPNLDGVDTVDEQVSIAMRKAGIGPHEKVKLKRFKVTRHE